MLNGGTSVTIPAGQTGVLGLCLQPNAGQALPAPGTQLSFMVTATSATNSAITQTVTVSFTMPAVDAVTIVSNPVELSTLPGLAATATVTLQNVGNVAASAALSFTTDTGLTLTGLNALPITLAIGQTATETVQLTPDADVPLNSTLQATVNVGPAVTQNLVSVVNVNTSTSFAEAGQMVSVSADVLNGVTEAEQAQASFTVLDGSGNVVFTSAAVPLTLSNLTNVATVNLVSFDTSALAPGQYTIRVSIADSSANPIPGATGTASLVIDAPVTASLAVSSDAISPTDSTTVTNTLTVGSQTILGNVATDGVATNVALNGNLAYVANTQDIAVINLSVIRPKTADRDHLRRCANLNQGGLNLVQIDGNNLIVASANTSNIASFKLLVYSLTDPASPVLVSSTTIPYFFPTGLVVQGNTPSPSIPTYGRLLRRQRQCHRPVWRLPICGFEQPASARIGRRHAFNDTQASPQGGNTNLFDAAPINSQVTYVAGSTSTGANTQLGNGQVLIVNTANPAADGWWRTPSG